MARRKESYSTYLEPRQAARLRELSLESGKPQSEYVRFAIDMLFAAQSSEHAGPVELRAERDAAIEQLRELHEIIDAIRRLVA